MISSVRGSVLSVGLDRVVVEVGGVGLQIQCTPQTAAGLRVGREAVLDTVLVVREDSLTLYGFDDEASRETFELVQTVSGIGPRIALALLATLSPDELRSAVAAGDHRSLTRVPGIGAKGAQRIVLELAGRLPAPTQATTITAAGAGWRDQVAAGLESLGWSAREAQRAVEAVAAREDLADALALADVPVLLRAGLQFLGRG